MMRRVLTSTLFAAALMAAPLAAQTSDIVIKQYDDGGIYEARFETACSMEQASTHCPMAINIQVTG